MRRMNGVFTLALAAAIVGCPAVTLAAGDVVLVHGYLDTGSAWVGTATENLFTPINSFRTCSFNEPTLVWTDPIATQAQRLRGWVDNDPDVIAITHSMGSLSARDAVRQQFQAAGSTRMKTIITICGVHAGVPLANALDDGGLDVGKHIWAILGAIAAGGNVALSAAGDLIINTESKLGWTGPLIETIYYGILAKIVHPLAIAPSRVDLKPGSTFLTQLAAAQSQETGIVRVSVICKEARPEVWRLAASAMSADKQNVVDAINAIQAILAIRATYYLNDYLNTGNPISWSNFIEYDAKWYTLFHSPRWWRLLIGDNGHGNDGVVPEYSQHYPGADRDYFVQGVTHIDAKGAAGVAAAIASELTYSGTHAAIYGSPPAPALLGPVSNGASCPELVWDVGCVADSFQVQVGSDPSFASGIAFDSRGIRGPTLDVWSLTPGLTYEWRARGYNNAGDGPWSSARAMVLGGSVVMPNQAPYVVSNLNGAYRGELLTLTFNPSPTNCPYTFTYVIPNAPPTNYHSWPVGNVIYVSNDGVSANVTLNIDMTATSPFGAVTTRVPVALYQGDRPPACPYVSVWNGRVFVDDNNILPQSEYAENGGRSVVDLYPLRETPVVDHGRYLLKLREFENERSKIGRCELIAVDHPGGTEVNLTRDGRIGCLETLGPVVARADVENGVLEHGGSSSGSDREMSMTSGRRIMLEPLRSSRAAQTGVTPDGIVVHGATTLKMNAIAGVPKAGGGLASSFTLRQRASSAYLELSASTPVPTVTFQQGARISGMEWVRTMPASALQINALRLESARSEVFGDVRTRIGKGDEAEITLVDGADITLAFKASPIPQGFTRTFVLRTRGSYVHLAGPSPNPAITSAKGAGQNRLEVRPAGFGDQTSIIEYSLASAGQVRLVVFDIQGRVVRALASGYRLAGTYRAAMAGDPGTVPSGVYYVRITLDDLAGKPQFSQAVPLHVLR